MTQLLHSYPGSLIYPYLGIFFQSEFCIFMAFLYEVAQAKVQIQRESLILCLKNNFSHL